MLRVSEQSFIDCQTPFSYGNNALLRMLLDYVSKQR